jgi:ornithine carbamoyltransferase
MRASGTTVSDIRKKTFLLNMIEAATGIHGPYMLQLAAAAPQSVTYADAKKSFLEHEQTVIARSKSNNNKAGSEGARQLYTDEWVPYDGKKRRVGSENVWVYDKDTAQGYMDPHTLSATTAMVQAASASALVATTVPNSRRNGKKNGKGKNRPPRYPCPLCCDKATKENSMGFLRY